MKRDIKAYLHDVHKASLHILTFTKELSIEDYSNTELVKSAVERQFVIIGEALVQMRSNYPDLLNQISDAEKIIGFRNVLVHGYDMIDDATVWSAIKTNLPTLIEEIKALKNT